MRLDFYSFLIGGIIIVLVAGILSLFVDGVAFWMPMFYGGIVIPAICKMINDIDLDKPIFRRKPSGSGSGSLKRK